MTTETPYKISVPDAQIDALKAKLAQATFPNELDEAGWSYGVPLADIKRLVEHWKTGYDWRVHEARMNDTLPHFTRDIDVDDGFGTLKIHYVHQKSTRENAVPLLFVHGWPGSFLEVSKILPLLTDASVEGQVSFHVVAVSLPGYTFSDAPTKKGFNGKKFAEVGHKLMLALGYDQYVLQGGDWGYLITRSAAHKYGPKHAKAWHTNAPWGFAPTLSSSPSLYLQSLLKTWPSTPAEKAAKKRTDWIVKEGLGYNLEHSTQPQTVGYGLSDSPVGLLAWIYEKMVNWTDGYPWSDDEVLTWISLYWFSKSGPASAIRIYYEVDKAGERESIKTDIPTIPHGASFFPKEMIRHPMTWVKNASNVVFTNEHDKGGHFAAYERPVELVEDLRKMFGKGGPAFGVVEGKNGV